MADSFRASFVLALKDDLSVGLRHITADVRKLRDLAKELGFKPLEGADAIVNRVDRDIAQLNRDLGTTARQAESATGALRRMGAAELGRDREQSAALRRQAALAKQAAAAAGLPSGTTIALPSLRRDQALARQAAAAAGFASGPTIPLGYEGQRVPSIPPPPVPWSQLNPTPATRGMRERLGGAWQTTRERVGQFNDHVGLVGGAMAGMSLAEPIREAAEFENVLTHIAITAGATSDQVRGKVAEMARTYRDMALSVQQSSHDIAESAQFLITTGIGEAMTNQLLPIIAKAATAYNTPMSDAVQGAFSMHEELKIAPEDMRGALSAAALAAKQGHFSFSDISQFLPSVAAQAATGISGRQGLDALLAALETSRRGAGTSGQAATNLQDFLSYINAPIGTKSFAKSGIDLPGLLRNAETAGVNPIEAVVQRMRQLTAGMSDAQSANTLGKLFHNQEARIFVETMLRELQYYEDTKKKISAASENTIDEDFQKAQNLHTRLKVLAETSAQLNQQVGLGFSWVVPIGSALLGGVLVGMNWLNLHLPGATQAVLGLTGGMLGLVAVMGVLGTVAGPIKAGAELLRLGKIMRSVFSTSALRLAANPYTALVVMFAAAVYDIWQHWDKFRASFVESWDGLKQIVSGDIWAGLRTVSDAFWGPNGTMHRLMDDFVGSLPDWAKSFTDALGTAMQNAYAGIAEIFKNPLAPFLPMPQPPTASKGEHGGVAPPRMPTPEEQPNFKPPISYQVPAGAAGADVRRIHVTFEADVPGRATARYGDENGPARGPMLTRT